MTAPIDREAVLLEAAALLDEHRADLAADAVVVSFGSHAPTVAAYLDHYSVSVRSDGAIYTANAKHLPDAAALAKGKANDARIARENKAKKQAEQVQP